MTRIKTVSLNRYAFGFIGAGKLAGSVIRGLMRAKLCAPGDIIASDPNEQTRSALKQDLDVNVTTENTEVAKSAKVIFIGVKPGLVLPLLRGLHVDLTAGRVRPVRHRTDSSDRRTGGLTNKLVISLAAGVRLKNMEAVSKARFMRALTNTPSAICRAATAIARGTRTTNEDVARAQRIFSAIGIVVEVEEDQIDAVTALAGSGPAFIYTVIEALAEGGKKMGLAPNVALTLATQTVLGAAQLALESRKSPGKLIEMVVSPGGTSAAGLDMMKKLGTSESLIAAIKAATKRGQEMAQENL
jgi:pyrroline-5-carboxylate reductase